MDNQQFSKVIESLATEVAQTVY